MIATRLQMIAGCAFALSAAVAWAGAGPEEIARLGRDLTPVGAEKAGNKDNSIPAWDGGLTKPPAGFDVKKGYADPFAAEAPLFTITAANAEQYKDKLSVGQLAMLKKYPTFKMIVYPSHRTAAYPASVTEDIKKFAGTAALAANGNGVVNSGSSTVPFPIPTKGEEVLWNDSLRWRGGGTERDWNWYVVQASGDNYKVGAREHWISAKAGFLEPKSENLSWVLTAEYSSPPTLEGTIYLAWDTLDQSQQGRQGWIYNAGQRRVRRIPELCCDFNADGTDGLRFTDQYDGWNGPTDRYDWKLLGKREMYVPYNTYKLTDKSLKLADVVHKNHLNPDLMRYELHRVWAVEGTLKAGARHIAPKRTLFIDEDSWQVVVQDIYDSRGTLWRYQDGPTIQYYDVLVPWYALFTIHDLTSGGYIVNQTSFDVTKPWTFGVKGKLADFQADELRRMGTK
jgi:hypothetical protein